MALHLIKLSVGSSNLDDLRRWQAHWGATHPPLRHTTRNYPRRAAELLEGGSIYWVINRIVTARQLLVDIVEGAREDGSKGCDLLLDPVLVPVRGQFCKPFQGWRYLRGEDAPADAAESETRAEMPEELQRELARLGLL
jgi:hypothetical protein